MRVHLLFATAVAATASVGCTLIGLGLGAAIDRGKPSRRELSGAELISLKSGKTVALQLADGRRVEGVLSGVEQRTPETYAPLYASAREARPEGLDLPALGPGASLIAPVSDGKELPEDLLGLDIRGIIVRAHDKPARTVPFEAVAVLRDTAGVSISGQRLARLVASRQVPLLSEIRLEGQAQRVPVDQVTQIEVRVQKNAKTIGALVGLATDVLVVVAATKSLEWDISSCTTPNCVNSCPFVYSFDGGGYVRDAEVFGGAILEAAQHSDRTRLDHLVESDGRYRVRIANELPETDSLDALRILVVDAPPGVRVVPAPDGRLLTVADPRPPRLARDLRGHVWTQAVSATDERVWSSQAFGRDASREDDLRDGLVLEFERPQGVDAANIVFNIRSTPWASHLLGEVLELQGASLNEWRGRMNADMAARGIFFAALRREGLPIVRVWDGDAWRIAGALVDLGPVLARDEGLRIDLSGIPGDTLRVRVDSTPGLWIIDSVSADFSAPAMLYVEALRPASARMRGRDVRDLLLETDARRLVIERGETAEVVFAAVPPRAGFGRSFLVEATGHYDIHLNGTGEPRIASFDRLLNEPGAFSRFSLELFAEELRRARVAADVN